MTSVAVEAPIEVGAVTFDFGNTLVRVTRDGLAAVVAETAQVMRQRRIVADEGAFLEAWHEERERQFREELPALREVSLPERVVRVLARLRGMPPPAVEERWDDSAADRLVDASEIQAAVDAYSWAFVARMAPVPDASAVLERLAGDGFTLAILSNWPLAATIDSYVESRDWLPFLSVIVVSQRVGVIKPHRAIFDHARERLRLPAGRILHVGDDWAADVVGARRAGWRAAFLRDRQDDTPLPTSEPGAEPGAERADLEIDELSDVVPLVRRWVGGGVNGQGPPRAGR